MTEVANVRASLVGVGNETADVEGDTGQCRDGTACSPLPAPSETPAPMYNLFTAAMSYNGYTITDGALRLIVLLHAADLGFNAIEIAFMFSMYEVSGRHGP